MSENYFQEFVKYIMFGETSGIFVRPEFMNLTFKVPKGTFKCKQCGGCCLLHSMQPKNIYGFDFKGNFEKNLTTGCLIAPM